MTIGIGILCKDGIVIAGDTMFSNQITQFHFPKTRNIANFPVKGANCIYTVAGSESAINLFHSKINHNDTISALSIYKNDVVKMMTTFSVKIKEMLCLNDIHLTQELNKNLANRKDADPVPSIIDIQHIIGFNDGDNFQVFQCAAGMQPIQFDSNNFCRVIGSGYIVSAPSISLIKQMLNIKEQPDIKQGRLLAYWTIKYAIENAGNVGVGGDINILTMAKNNNNIEVKKNDDFFGLEEGRQNLLKHIENYYSVSEIKDLNNL